ncbi:MAG: hypothetical protein PHU85_18720 [Phycisphaerae bacterium]|nr:hypothetical protein [Phycisphaerae bacterium]
MIQPLLFDDRRPLLSTAPEPDKPRLTCACRVMFERLLAGPATATELEVNIGRRYGARAWDINKWLEANGDGRRVKSRRLRGSEWEYYLEGKA